MVVNLDVRLAQHEFFSNPFHFSSVNHDECVEPGCRLSGYLSAAWQMQHIFWQTIPQDHLDGPTGSLQR
jgi:hypothetical protein